MTLALLPFTWTGEAMEPLPNFAKRCDERFVVGERYRLEVVEDRSHRSHSHFFAAVHDAWLNLPEDKLERFPTDEHLRKWALIKAGFRDERTIVVASKAEARRLVAFMRPLDDYAVVVARDAVVVVWTAKSQSYKAMGRKEFQRSKDAVLTVCAELVGVTVADLRKEGGRAA